MLFGAWLFQPPGPGGGAAGGGGAFGFATGVAPRTFAIGGCGEGEEAACADSGEGGAAFAHAFIWASRGPWDAMCRGATR